MQIPIFKASGLQIRWNGDSHTVGWVGPVYTFRAPKVFQFQIGMGYKANYGPAATSEMRKVPVGLMYSIGVYFPI